MSLVSVILPNYNHEDFIEARIESILAQTYQNFEVIILDDASNDGSQEIIKGYSEHPKVSHIILNEKNSGSTFIQWEKGIKLAKGEFIWIAESDDLSEVNFLEFHISNLKTHSNYGVSFSASTWIDIKGNEVHKPGHEEKSFKIKGLDLIENDFLNGPIIYNASSAVFKKELLGNIDFENLKKYKYCGDWYFWYSLGQKTNFLFDNKRLNKFRRHDGNVSFQAEKDGLHIKEGLLIVNDIFKNFKIPLVNKLKARYFWLRKIMKSDIANKRKFIKLLF